MDNEEEEAGTEEEKEEKEGEEGEEGENNNKLSIPPLRGEGYNNDQNFINLIQLYKKVRTIKRVGKSLPTIIPSEFNDIRTTLFFL